MTPNIKLGGSRLPELLSKRNMTQAEFARRLGTSRQFVNKVIKKEKTLSLEQAFNAASILQCSVNDLYNLTFGQSAE